jgi:CRISPR system Cascade subunit CasE
MTFQLLRLQPDPSALAVWATRHGVLSSDGDLGYALHALLGAAFDDLAPKPFRYLGGQQGLLAYTSADLESLRANAALATPDVARALGLDALDARPFPAAWKTGQRLGFEVRVRPVMRSEKGGERDVFLHAVTSAHDGQDAAKKGSLVQRAAVYTPWLIQQWAVEGAAEIVETRMESFKITRVLRKAGNGENGKRKTTSMSGPDVVFKGQLRVGDPEAFHRLLARGVGRHRAFGFGMVLLRPARAC